VPLARQTRERATALFGETHPVTWRATNALALVLSAAGRGRESHTLWAGLVARLRPLPQAQSAQHLGRYLANLTASLQDQGRSAEALATMREAGRIPRATAAVAAGAATPPPPTSSRTRCAGGSGCLAVRAWSTTGRAKPSPTTSGAPWTTSCATTRPSG